MASGGGGSAMWRGKGKVDLAGEGVVVNGGGREGVGTSTVRGKGAPDVDCVVRGSGGGGASNVDGGEWVETSAVAYMDTESPEEASQSGAPNFLVY